MTDDGWLRTGDSGFVDRRGHLVIVDRAKDVGKLADGTPFAPQFVENKLKFSPFIAEAVAVWRSPAVCRGDRRDRSDDGRQLGGAAQPRLHLVPGSERQARGAAADRARRSPRSTPRCPQPRGIRRFLLLNKEFDADDNEITRTRKIRRRFVAEKYAAVVDAFYRGERGGRAHHRDHLRGRPQGDAAARRSRSTMSTRPAATAERRARPRCAGRRSPRLG